MFKINSQTKHIQRVDYHIHTLYSDGRHSMEDCVKAAINQGISEIAFTDHVWRTSKWVNNYIDECNAVRAKFPKIKILIGAEAKAVNLNGEVDIKPEDAAKLDFVTGSVHRKLPDETQKKYKDLVSLSSVDAAIVEKDIISAMVENPDVDVIGHPMRLYYKFFYLNKTPTIFPSDILQDILLSVSRSGGLIELNFKVPNFKEVLDIYLKSNVFFVLGSDAHCAEDIGKIPYERLV